MFHITEVGLEREQPEERAQEVLPFGGPGHRFHMQRVQGKERGHGAALPERPRHRPEDNEEEQGVGGVQKEAHQVVPPCVQTEELDVGHVHEPGERVPVVDVGGGKGPDEAVYGQPLPDDRIVGDVVIVVEDDQRQNRDGSADQDRPAEGG
jgi:hypothetical protein